MRIVLAASFVLVVACSPKGNAKQPEDPAASSADTVSPDADPAPASSADEAAASGGCKGPEDCKGGYCQRGPIGDAQCTNEPNIMNAVILCNEDKDCKDLCVAFKGSEQCGKEEGTCNCDGK